MNAAGMSHPQILAQFYGWRPEGRLLRAIALMAPPRIVRGGRGGKAPLVLRLPVWATDVLDHECTLKQKRDLVIAILRESRHVQK